MIRGNSALMKCNLPAFVSDFVSVSAWFMNDERIERTEIHGMLLCLENTMGQLGLWRMHVGGFPTTTNCILEMSKLSYG